MSVTNKLSKAILTLPEEGRCVLWDVCMDVQFFDTYEIVRIHRVDKTTFDVAVKNDGKWQTSQTTTPITSILGISQKVSRSFIHDGKDRFDFVVVENVPRSAVRI